jgi:hypothetical protein
VVGVHTSETLSDSDLSNAKGKRSEGEVRNLGFTCVERRLKGHGFSRATSKTI